MNNLDTLQKGKKITVVTVKDSGFTMIDRREYHSYEIDGADTSLLHRSVEHNRAFATLLTGDNVTVIRIFVKKLVEFNIDDLMPTLKILTRGSGEKWISDVCLLTPDNRTAITELIQKVLTVIITEMILGIKIAVLSGKPLTPFMEQSTFATDICSQFVTFILDKRTTYFNIE
jgi:hypothetical protein